MPGFKRMSDIVDKVTRSRMMSGIRRKNTKPEIFIRKGVYMHLGSDTDYTAISHRVSPIL